MAFSDSITLTPLPHFGPSIAVVLVTTILLAVFLRKRDMATVPSETVPNVKVEPKSSLGLPVYLGDPGSCPGSISAPSSRARE
ncbi:hypothetical protein R3P38DRAFT_3242969 [Favolaschia claudopus]|uniref:ATP synthase F0 subunit 8 n=1 Tax=Favolaschia claudopus TaxID=2862362 RepID=A0AAV9Z3H4_9AGAR